MQNAEKQTSKVTSTTKEHKTQLKLPTETAAAPPRTTFDLEKDSQPSTEQSQAKLKTRSRFSAAFRSLSKSKSKKQQLSQELLKDKPKSEEQLVLASGTDDLTSIGDISTDSGIRSSKKKSLTQRLLLGGLKKSKVRPHSLATSDDLSVLSSSRERLSTLETASPATSSSTLQITISGKKVEPVKGKSKTKSKTKSLTKSATSETDYLTPSPDTTATPTATTAAAAAAAAGKSTTTTTTLTTKDTTSNSRTTKLIVAKVSKESPAAKKKKQLKTAQTSAIQAQIPTTTTTTTVAATATAAAAALPLFEEKIVITESTRDTPPRERAPAKPSRASAVQYASSSGAVRKQSSKSSGSKSLSSRQERELMQQQQQRGHRLTRPTTGTTANQVNSVLALESPSSTEPEPEPEPYPPPTIPTTPPKSPTATTTIVSVTLSDVEEQTDIVSLAESARSGSPIAAQVRFAVGSAVRGPAADAYEAALAAAATQQPSSNEEPSDSSLRRLNFAHQQHQQQQFISGDHDSIEGRRETLRYQSVATEYTETDSQSEEGGEYSELSKPMPAFGDLTIDQEMEPTIMAPSSEKREHLYKILVIGELGTGKTSFIKRYVHQFFSQNYRATIGVDFALKVLHWDANTIVRLQLWDIAGQERFGNMTRVYYKEAVGAFIVFDVTRSGTFDCVSKWKEDLDSKVQLPDGSPIPCILLANKCDQEKQGIVTQPERMDEYVRENGFAGWFETSAKENINIDEAARALVNKILINDKLITADATDDDKFNLSNVTDSVTDSKSKCSC